MFDNPFFQSVIALITLYLVFSQLTLSLVELPAGILNWRGKYLHKNLQSVLGKKVCDAFYASPAIKGLMTPIRTVINESKAWPAYVSDTLFAQTIINWVSEQDTSGAATLISKFKGGLDKLDINTDSTDAARTALVSATDAVNKATDSNDAAAKAVAMATSALQSANDPTTKAAAGLTVTSATNEKNRTASLLMIAQTAKENADTQLATAIAEQAETKNFTSLLRPLYAAALAAAATAPEQSSALQKNLEAWFHEYGERMTGWYKRDQRPRLLIAGFLVAILADVDTVRLARFIFDSDNAKARTALVEMGVAATQKAAPAAGSNAAHSNDAASSSQQQALTELANKAVTEFRATLDALPKASLPLGPLRWLYHSTKQVTVALPIVARKPPQDSTRIFVWDASADDFGMPVYAQRWQLNKTTGKVKNDLRNDALSFMGVVLEMLGGWLLTAFAMMLGAPFWFDTLCGFVNIRNIGLKPAKAAGNT